MECSICYEDISAATGQVSLSCSHHYHLGCIGRWLLKNSSCPLCRGETCEKEKIVVESSYEESEESEDSGTTIEFDHGGGEPSTSIVDDVPEFDAAAHALWVMRETFKMLDDGEDISSEGAAPPATAAQWTWEHELANDGVVSQIRMRSAQMGNRAFTYGEDRGYESS